MRAKPAKPTAATLPLPGISDADLDLVEDALSRGLGEVTARRVVRTRAARVRRTAARKRPRRAGSPDTEG
jgi:hypothetical protein